MEKKYKVISLDIFQTLVDVKQRLWLPVILRQYGLVLSVRLPFGL